MPRALFVVFECLVCRVLLQHSRTQNLISKVFGNEKAKLRRPLQEIAAEHIRWIRRIASRPLRREGWLVRKMGMHGLWREEGLQRPIFVQTDTSKASRRIGAASQGRKPTPGLGQGWPVQRRYRWMGAIWAGNCRSFQVTPRGSRQVLIETVKAHIHTTTQDSFKKLQQRFNLQITGCHLAANR